MLTFTHGTQTVSLDSAYGGGGPAYFDSFAISGRTGLYSMILDFDNVAFSCNCVKNGKNGGEKTHRAINQQNKQKNKFLLMKQATQLLLSVKPSIPMWTMSHSHKREHTIGLSGRCVD